MNLNNREERTTFRNLLVGMAETFRATLTEHGLNGYFAGLADMPIEAINAAVAMALRTSRYMPTVVELRELAGEVRPDDRAMIAWGEVQGAEARHDFYATVDFGDKLINAVIRRLAGNWRDWCDLPVDEKGFRRAEFVKLYTAFCRNPPRPTLLEPLPGYHDLKNVRDGYDPRPVTQIGTQLPPLPGLMPGLQQAIGSVSQRLGLSGFIKRAD